MRTKDVIAEAVRETVAQQTSDLSTLHRQARQANSGLQKFGFALANQVGAEFSLGKRKDIRRAFEKASKKYDGDCSRLTDLSRSRIIFDSPEQLEELRHQLDPVRQSPFLVDWAGKEYLVRSYQDTFKTPSLSGYMALDTKIEIPLTLGRFHIGEIQGVDRSMMECYEKTHRIWENQRRLVDAFKDAATGMDSATAAKYRSMEDQRRNMHLYAALAGGYITAAQAQALDKKAEDQSRKLYDDQKFDIAA